ncbi:MAG: HD domain-containing protein [Gemmatimonadales bacterium]|nr:MAG: HD domain-containing protein [Gemmatimonadales bacterium]
MNAHQLQATAFLTALGRALSVLTLYGEDHPTRTEVEDEVFARLMDFKYLEQIPTITFLDAEVVVNRRPIRELRGWGWGPRLSEVGIQRMEFPSAPNRQDLRLFLEEATHRLTRNRGARAGDGSRQEELLAGVIGASIRFGRVGIGGSRSDEEPVARVVTATLDFSLDEEFGAVSWLQEEVKGGRGLHLAEAEAVVRSLAIAARSHQHVLATLFRPAGGSPGPGMGSHLDPAAQGFATSHAMNVSVLSMALAEFMGMNSGAVRAVGIAGLLHDLGTTRVPPGILTKPGSLTPSERELVERHPADGARLIIRNEERLDLAAVVAYEHHVRYDGSGYPRFRFPRPLHPVSHLVHVCATFDTLLSDRPWRGRWPEDRALEHLLAGAGSEFHPDFARDLVRMIRLERRL